MAVNKLASIITSEIKKTASERGTHNETMYINFNNIALNIDGQEKMCEGIAKVDVTFDWYKDEGDYDNPPEHNIYNLEYDIESIDEFGIANDDTYYTDEQVAKILKANYDTVYDEIYDKVETMAYEADTSGDNE